MIVRDATIFLEGEILKGKPQVKLRTIVSKVLSTNRALSLMDQKIANDLR
jgi:hypothetical protein